MHRKASIAIIVVAIAMAAVMVIGGIYGWYVTQQDQSIAVNQQQDNQGEVQESPYLDWTAFCDPISNVCFRYPFGWFVDQQNTADRTRVTITNPDTTMEIVYDSRPASAQPAAYTVLSVEDLHYLPSEPLAVMGGYGNRPMFALVNKDTVQDAELGQSITLAQNIRFTKSDSTPALLTARPFDTNFTASQAQEWIDSEMGRIARLAILSYYLQ